MDGNNISLNKSWIYDPSAPWPLGEPDPSTYVPAVNDLIKEHIKNPLVETEVRALLVVHKGKIVGEGYLDNFSSKFLFNGWSITKTLISSFIGILINQKHLSLDDTLSKLGVCNFKTEDPRGNITIENLLRMSSGMEWDEDYTEYSDVTKSLFFDQSIIAQFCTKNLKHSPGTHWYYSSAETNILSYIVRMKAGRTLQYFFDFIHNEFISKLRLNSMILEPDPLGTYVGSSYGYATARDWAKVGLFYLNKGVWNNEVIVSKEYINKATTKSSFSHYGFQIWLHDAVEKNYPSKIPSDVYFMNGFRGQKLVVFPSHDLVIVRFGHDKTEMNELQILETFVQNLFEILSIE